jgi:hypothetical protein
MENVMRHSSSEASITPLARTGGAGKAYQSFAEAWVARAIEAGCDPRMRQEPLSSKDDAGEWMLVVSAAGLSHSLYPGKLPERFLDEALLILGRLGRIEHDPHLKPWHGNILLDDTSSLAIALRVKMIREALHMDYAHFYGSLQINAKVGEALEDGRVTFIHPDEEMLKAVCLYYGVPEEWLTLGAAEDIEG